MQLFISYARPDRPRAESLTLRLKQAGITVWLDSDLFGGQAWWDRILEQIRACDAVVAAVSNASINSLPCRAERDYAMLLGKPVLPLIFEAMSYESLPADIARIQAVDYSQPSEQTAFELIGAIMALPKPRPLPDPPPKAPDLPPTRFGGLADRIAEASLGLDDQLEILGRLEVALGPVAPPHDRQAATELLLRMEERPDLFAATARQIEKLRARITADQDGGPRPSGPSGPQPDPRYANDGRRNPSAGRDAHAGMAMISVGRQTDGLQYQVSSWVILIDGKKAGKIWQGQRQEFPVSPGTHEIQIKVANSSSYSSQIEAVTLNPDERASFACGVDHPFAMRDALSAMAWKNQLTAPRNSFIRLRRE
jgi:hypothetical protein